MTDTPQTGGGGGLHYYASGKACVGPPGGQNRWVPCYQTQSGDNWYDICFNCDGGFSDACTEDALLCFNGQSSTTLGVGWWVGLPQQVQDCNGNWHNLDCSLVGPSTSLSWFETKISGTYFECSGFNLGLDVCGLGTC
ncbi:MAG: hypothetical protein ACP5QO_15040 [Clostridia bacterium]